MARLLIEWNQISQINRGDRALHFGNPPVLDVHLDPAQHRRRLRSKPAQPFLALAATGFFAVFPPPESVCNIKHREELLAFLFGISAWIALEHAPKTTLRILGASALFLALVKSAATLILARFWRSFPRRPQ